MNFRREFASKTMWLDGHAARLSHALAQCDDMPEAAPDSALLELAEQVRRFGFITPFDIYPPDADNHHPCSRAGPLCPYTKKDWATLGHTWGWPKERFETAKRIPRVDDAGRIERIARRKRLAKERAARERKQQERDRLHQLGRLRETEANEPLLRVLRKELVGKPCIIQYGDALLATAIYYNPDAGLFFVVYKNIDGHERATPLKQRIIEAAKAALAKEVVD